MTTRSSAGQSRQTTDHATRWTLFSWRTWITTSLAVIAMAAIGFFTQGTQEPARKSNEAATATTVFGPGAWVEPSRTSTEASNDSGPALAPAIDANGNLVVDTVLRDAIEFFLLEQTNGDAMTALRGYMASHLPPAASKDAVQIAEQYGIYMQRHDSQIAAQNFSTGTGTGTGTTLVPDTNRIATWLQQRTRLRHEVLGDAVTQAWYQNEDAQLQQALGELRQRAAANIQYVEQPQDPVASASVDDGVPVVPHWRNPGDARQHEQYLVRLLRQATQNFEARAIERRQFADRYNAYASKVTQIAANLGPDSAERAALTSALREKFFLDNTEKQLAQERWVATHPASR